MSSGSGSAREKPRYDAAREATPVPEDVHKRRKEIQEDYGQYVATEDIMYDGAVAYRTGDPVPASNVKRHGYDTSGVVKKAETKE